MSSAQYIPMQSSEYNDEDPPEYGADEPPEYAAPQPAPPGQRQRTVDELVAQFQLVEDAILLAEQAIETAFPSPYRDSRDDIAASLAVMRGSLMALDARVDEHHAWWEAMYAFDTALHELHEDLTSYLDPGEEDRGRHIVRLSEAAVRAVTRLMELCQWARMGR